MVKFKGMLEISHRGSPGVLVKSFLHHSLFCYMTIAMPLKILGRKSDLLLLTFKTTIIESRKNEL